MNRLVIKIAIVNLQDSDIKLDVFRYFNNEGTFEVFTVTKTQDINELVKDLQNRFDKILIINGLENICKYKTYYFNFHERQAFSSTLLLKSLTNVCKTSYFIEELINNPQCDGVNTFGFVKGKEPIINQPDSNLVTEYNEYMDEFNECGIYTTTDKESNIYITFNSLDKIQVEFPHFNVIYNEKYNYKAAICIYGNMSDAWLYTRYTFLHHVYNCVDPDVFIHVYSDGNASNEQIKSKFDDILPNYEIQIEDYNTVYKSQYELTDELKEYTGFNQKIEDPMTGKITSKGLLDCLKIYSITKCNDMRKKSNGKYDIVIFCDLNLLYFSNLSLSNIQDNYIYTCYGVLCNSLDYNFLVCEPHVIDTICESLKNVSDIYANNKEEKFDLTTCLLLIVNNKNIEIGKKIINCSLTKDNNMTIYKHPNSWVYLTPESRDYMMTFTSGYYDNNDIYSTQKFKDSIFRD